MSAHAPRCISGRCEDCDRDPLDECADCLAVTAGTCWRHAPGVTYGGGGWFRVADVPKGDKADMVHAPELVEHLRRQLAEAEKRATELFDASREWHALLDVAERQLAETRAEFAVYRNQGSPTALRQQLAASQARERALRTAFEAVITWSGVQHEDDCPEDDTCDCAAAPIIAQANAAFALPSDDSALRAVCLRVARHVRDRLKLMPHNILHAVDTDPLVDEVLGKERGHG